MATSSISFASFFFLALLPFPCFSSIAAAVRFSFSLNIFAIFCAAFFSRPVGRRDRAAEAAVRAVDDAGAEDDEDEVEEVETAPEPAEDDADDDDDGECGYDGDMDEGFEEYEWTVEIEAARSWPA